MMIERPLSEFMRTFQVGILIVGVFAIGFTVGNDYPGPAGATGDPEIEETETVEEEPERHRIRGFSLDCVNNEPEIYIYDDPESYQTVDGSAGEEGRP